MNRLFINDVSFLYLMDNEIRALSWKQPFAMAMLHEKIETRTWDTKYRGLVLICASQSGYSIETTRKICGDVQFDRLMSLSGDMIFSKAIAIGQLIDSWTMRPEDEDACFVQYQAPWVEERTRKDGSIHFVKKRLYCHIYWNVRQIVPFPWVGSQGWRTLDQETKRKIKIIA